VESRRSSTCTQPDLAASPSMSVSKRSQQTATIVATEDLVAELPKSDGQGLPTRRRTWGHFDPSRDPRLLGI
jgi:hypothetical protein